MLISWRLLMLLWFCFLSSEKNLTANQHDFDQFYSWVSLASRIIKYCTLTINFLLISTIILIYSHYVCCFIKKMIELDSYWLETKFSCAHIFAAGLGKTTQKYYMTITFKKLLCEYPWKLIRAFMFCLKPK